MLINPIVALIFSVIMCFFYYIVKTKWAKKACAILITMVAILTISESFIYMTSIYTEYAKN